MSVPFRAGKRVVLSDLTGGLIAPFIVDLGV
jgi:hypothetical protein